MRALLDRRTAARRKPSRPRLLYLCHVDWGWIKQRPQHLAEHLGPYFDLTVAFNSSWRRSALVNPFRIGRRCIPLLRVPMRGRHRLLGWLDAILLRLSLRLLIALVRPAYIWLTWPDLYRYLPRHLRAPLVYDCMDDAQAFPGEQKRAAELARAEHELVNRAELVFVSSERLRSVLASRHGAAKTYHLLRNAYCPGPLATPLQPRPDGRIFRIGYCGTIAAWLDWELLLAAVEALPGVEFHLVGALDAGVAPAVHERILCCGPVRHEELPAAMGACDCLAMPFRVTPLIEAVDPVKLYEYIAFDKPIVAVYYDEIARFQPFVHFYRTRAEAIDLFSRLASGELAKNYSGAQRQSFLEQNTWEERARMAASVMQKGGTAPEAWRVASPAARMDEYSARMARETSLLSQNHRGDFG
jgi:glycosyltransferase involved in cell wall biosynthesis